MPAFRSVVAAIAAGVVVAGFAISAAGQAGQLPLAPLRTKGEALFPYLEGWFENPDGTFSLLFGYFNRNSEQIFDIPVGPNNRVEPGAPDQGQPTHFRPNRNNRMFTITVPKDFGNKRITWTLTANGLTQAVTAWLDPEYFVEPLITSGTGNTPPVIRIGEGPDHAGPPRGIARNLTAAVGQPLPLSVWTADKGATIVLDPNPPQRGDRGGGGGGAGRGRGAAAAVTIAWAKYRGPGNVTFAPQSIPVSDASGGTAATTATFDQAGDYWLRVTANEGAGEGGSGQCCSTSAIIRVNVKG